ncbi:hypothetical protein [Brachybacterium sp. UMB0905]|uniref:hypothetical protein n=1 Tax=Brachybacterium sp. UMB0905 TaxID=2069310 RepID=UPI000C807B81|nr:hypothetical protein [Brachybacterium sp. UMB0905]PMC76373.1 hypothetical protein CJ197_04250 [Brachybacterium sp. UMB0905]
MTPALINQSTIDKVCNADIARTQPWVRMTRVDTAVSVNGERATLHGWRERFDLWESAGVKR